MSKEIRQTIDKVKNFKQFVNESENNDFILNNDNVKTYTWTSGGKVKNIKVEFKVSENSIDIYVEDNFVGGFTLEYNEGYVMIRPESFDLEEIGYGRIGIYSFVIDTILNNELEKELESQLGQILGIDFESVLRTEKACNFWLKRGYGSEYDEEEHENGNQETIEIKIK